MTITARLACALALLVAPLAAAQGLPRIDELIAKLSGGDDAARALARQWLPRHGLDAVPALLPLADHDDAGIAWAALNVLGDIASETAQRGRLNDRRRMGQHLMSLTGPERKFHTRRRALQLLPRACPENLGVEPVAALLGDAAMREHALGALVEIDTHKARRALAAALDGADPAFAPAILLAIAAAQAPEGLDAALAHTASQDAAVRAAAALAIAWAGDPRHIEAMRRVRAKADAATAFDASDAMLRYADAMAKQGGNWELAMAIYRELLATAKDDAIRGAALAGLGAWGDETAVPVIVAAVNAADGAPLHAPAVAALERVRGRNGAKALLDAWPQLPAPMRAPMLYAFGRRADPLLVPVMAGAAADADAAVRHAAWEALAASGLPEAAAPLAAALSVSQPGPERDALRAAVHRMARAMQAKGRGAESGAAYLALYRTAPDDAARTEALDGVLRFPTPEAYDVLVQVTTPGQRAALPAPVLAGVAQSLLAAGRTADAHAIADGLLARQGDPATAAALLPLIGPLGGEYALARKMGFFSHWHVIGPFPWDKAAGFVKPAIDPAAVDLAAVCAGKAGQVAWKRLDAGAGLVDLMGQLSAAGNETGFAYATVHLPAAAKAALRLGSDDGIRAWVNGAEVHANAVDRGAALDQDVVPVSLRAGENAILLEISQNGGGWCFIARLTTAGGAPLAFEQR